MIAEVIVDIAHSQVDKVFDYIATPDTQKGQRVVVPFGRQTLEGYVLNLKETSNLPKEKLKSVIKTLEPYPIISDEFLKLSDYLVENNHLKRVDTLRLFLPSGMRKEKVRELSETIVTTSNFNKEEIAKQIRANSKNQLRLLDFIEENKSYVKSELNKKFGSACVNKFVEMKIFTESKQQKNRTPTFKKMLDKNVTLNETQLKIFNEIDTPQVHVLFGVTGSGKTEVYMHLIERCLSRGQTAIMLVPEIGLTPQVFGLFKARFGNTVAVLHSGLSLGERFDEWQRIRTKEATVVVGARSAIFAPVTDVGIIIIDEEHDGSYRSESNPRFYTHDVAKFRCSYNNCPLVLGSATPSIDTFFRAKTGEYFLHEMPERVNKREMPKVQIVDMKLEMAVGNTGMFSRQLEADLKDCIESGNQAMLFCNRRGFASFMVCRECGYVAKCDDCDAALVYHKDDNQLKCHFCGRRYKALTNCPNCKSSYIRMGAVGTQKVVEELKKLFPNVKILRMDFDTTQTKQSHAQILEEFSKTKPSILVGTQMIAKGHDFPNVTLVGIVDADMSLHFADFRSTERTFALLTQVAGRAGRADKVGKIVLQTYAPNHYVYKYMANYNYKAFFEREINIRQASKFPPFAQIVRILASGENDEDVKDVILKIHIAVKQWSNKNILFCQAMKSPVGRIQNKFRYQILLRLANENFKENINKIYNLCDENQKPNVSVFVEINPNNMS